MKKFILFLGISASLYGQYSSTYNPFTKKQDFIGGQQGLPGRPGDTGPIGPVGPPGSPNVVVPFTDALQVIWVHNEGQTNLLPDCYDTTVTPPQLIYPDSVYITDINTLTINFFPETTGYCTANFSGGSGGGNPLWANILAGTILGTDLLVGAGSTLGSTGGGVVTADALSALAKVTTVTMTGSSLPSAPPGVTEGTYYYDAVTNKFCVVGHNSSLSCTGAPGGGSVLSTSATNNQGVESVVSGNVTDITVAGSLRSAEKVTVVSSSTYSLSTNDRAHLMMFTNTGVTTVTLPPAGSSDFPNAWFVDIKNGSGTFGSLVKVVTSTSTFEDGGTTVYLGQGQDGRIISEGSNYKTIGFPTASPNGTANGDWFDPWNGPFHDVHSVGIVSTANQVRMFLFKVRAGELIIASKAALRIQTASSGTHFAVAIYKDQNTKLYESAAADTGGTGGHAAGDIQHPLFDSTVVLTSGLYWMAYSSDSASNAHTAINSFPATNGLWTGGGTLRGVTCINTANFTGGAIFPASCGASPTQYSATGPMTMLLEN